MNEKTYTKVILKGDYPDHSIMSDGNDYYMAHSPFYYAPGFLIWHSQDLMNWEPLCRVMPQYEGSAMAPDLLKYKDTYYIYYPAAGKKIINIPNTVKEINEYAFKPSNSLTDINFSDNITFIDDNAFWECTSLTSMLLPKSIAGIGDNAFTGCTNLTKIYINREEPPFKKKRTFYRTNGELVIYVPKGCKERYKNSETWRTLNIIEME